MYSPAADELGLVAGGTEQVNINASDVEFTGFISTGAAEALTISSGAITASKSFINVDTEAAAATDDLATINGGSEGRILIIKAADSTHTVVCKDGTKYLMQYRWRCTFRDAYYVCCLIWPWAHTKMPKIQQVIQHYAEQKLNVMNGKVVSLEEYKQAMSLE